MKTLPKKISKHLISSTHLMVLMLFTGCSQSFIVTQQGDQFSNDNISYEQFNRLRTGKYFEMRLNDSSAVPITLMSVGNDSIFFHTMNETVQRSLPFGQEFTLVYRQNDNGLNAMIGAFAGLVLSGAAAKSLFDFSDSRSSIGGFATVIAGTVAGALIGYNSETEIVYRLKSQKIYKP